MSSFVLSLSFIISNSEGLRIVDPNKGKVSLSCVLSIKTPLDFNKPFKVVPERDGCFNTSCKVTPKGMYLLTSNLSMLGYFKIGLL